MSCPLDSEFDKRREMFCDDGREGGALGPLHVSVRRRRRAHSNRNMLYRADFDFDRIGWEKDVQNHGLPAARRTFLWARKTKRYISLMMIQSCVRLFGL